MKNFWLHFHYVILLYHIFCCIKEKKKFIYFFFVHTFLFFLFASYIKTTKKKWLQSWFRRHFRKNCLILKGIVKWAESCERVNVLFFLFRDTLTQENQHFFKSMEILIFDTHREISAVISPFEFTQRHYSEGCLFILEKTCNVEC